MENKFEVDFDSRVYLGIQYEDSETEKAYKTFDIPYGYFINSSCSEKEIKVSREEYFEFLNYFEVFLFFLTTPTAVDFLTELSLFFLDFRFLLFSIELLRLLTYS